MSSFFQTKGFCGFGRQVRTGRLAAAGVGVATLAGGVGAFAGAVFSEELQDAPLGVGKGIHLMRSWKEERQAKKAEEAAKKG